MCFVLAVGAVVFSAPALAKYNQIDATRDCERAIVQGYGHQEFYGENFQNTGSNSYKIWGKVRVHHQHDKTFSCQVKHREVRSFKIHDKYDTDQDHDKDFDTGTAAAIGAGVLGAVIIGAALAGDDDNNDAGHQEARQRYQTNPDNDAMADREYLEKECAYEIQRHLQHDHGSVDRLRFQHVYLEQRDLRGQGDVRFAFGEERQLEFVCNFDRQGRIHDGAYRYY